MPCLLEIGGRTDRQRSKKDRMRQMIGLASPAIENMYPVFRQILSPDALTGT